MNEGASTKSTRLAYLDGLRGIAALAVVFYHYLATVQPLMVSPLGKMIVGIMETPLLRLMTNGRYAVFIFFVLSGFVLSRSAAKGNVTLPARLVTRYLRLTLPVWISIIFAWLLLHLFPTSRLQWEAISPNSWMKKYAFGKSVPGFADTLREGLYRTYLSGDSLYNHALWTMRVELIGSVGIYVLYRFCPSRYVWAALGVFVAATRGISPYLGFPIGAFLYEIWKRDWFLERNWGWGIFIVSLCLSMVAADLADVHNVALYSIAAGLLILSILKLPPLQRLLSAGFPQFLGRISFALYLVHLPLIVSVIAWLYFQLAGPLLLKLPLLLVVLLILSMFSAWVITIGIDEPLVKQLHRLKKLRWPGISS